MENQSYLSPKEQARLDRMRKLATLEPEELQKMQQDAKFCGSCGAPVEGGNFCSNCGHRL